MKKISTLFVSLGVLSLGVIAFTATTSDTPNIRLPRPHYHEEKTDPEWLRSAVQIHGHLGPAVVFGVRMGSAGLDAVKAQGYFDVEVTAEGPYAKPPQSCILDGLQLSTGATLGKRNVQVVETEEYLVKIKNKRTGLAVEIRPTPELLKLMWSRLEADDHDKEDAHAEMHRVEAVAREIAAMPQEKIMTLSLIKNDK